MATRARAVSLAPNCGIVLAQTPPPASPLSPAPSRQPPRREAAALPSCAATSSARPALGALDRGSARGDVAIRSTLPKRRPGSAAVVPGTWATVWSISATRGARGMTPRGPSRRLELVRAPRRAPWPRKSRRRSASESHRARLVGELVGEGVAQETRGVGETTISAAACRSLPSENVVLAATTRSCERRVFDYRDIGAVALKGLPRPCRRGRPIDGRAGKTASQALHEQGVAPLLGRRRGAAACCCGLAAGEERRGGRVVLLSGAQGSDKRLARRCSSRSPAAASRLRYSSPPPPNDSRAIRSAPDRGARAGASRETIPSEARQAAGDAVARVGSAEDARYRRVVSSATCRTSKRLDLAPHGASRKLSLEAPEACKSRCCRAAAGPGDLRGCARIDPTSREQLDRRSSGGGGPGPVMVTFRRSSRLPGEAAHGPSAGVERSAAPRHGAVERSAGGEERRERSSRRS